MCNAYYIIITVELRQAFFEDFFIFSESTRYCTFFVFLSFTPHMRLVELLFFYQFYSTILIKFCQLVVLHYLYSPNLVKITILHYKRHTPFGICLRLSIQPTALQEMLAFLAVSLRQGPAVKNMALKTSTIFLSLSSVGQSSTCGISLRKPRFS